MDMVAVVSAAPLYLVPEPEPLPLTVTQAALIMAALDEYAEALDGLSADAADGGEAVHLAAMAGSARHLSELIATHDVTFADVRPNRT